jgi:hypothetical protein
MKDIIITVDEETAAWLRAQAAAGGVSVPQLVSHWLDEKMRTTGDYKAAMQRFLSHRPFKLDWIDGRPPTREEIYDRARAREELGQEAPEELKSKEVK